jgi:hypothetical protein
MGGWLSPYRALLRNPLRLPRPRAQPPCAVAYQRYRLHALLLQATPRLHPRRILSGQHSSPPARAAWTLLGIKGTHAMRGLVCGVLGEGCRVMVEFGVCMRLHTSQTRTQRRKVHIRTLNDSNFDTPSPPAPPPRAVIPSALTPFCTPDANPTPSATPTSP